MTSFAPGQCIDGRFELGTLIGEGSTAKVYAALHTETGLACTLKFLEARHLQSPAQLARFRGEAKVLARLKHPNILHCVHTGEANGIPYIATDFAEGGSLADRVARYGALTPRLALAATMDACAAVIAAHQKGILHRDIKPGNMLITNGRIVLADFGLAQAEGHSLTMTGTTLGSLGFMAPEQLQDAKRVSPQADIYSLGASLFALLQGGIAQNLCACDPWDPIYGEIAPEVVSVIARATRRRPDQRHANATELGMELGRARDTLGPDPIDALPLHPQIAPEAPAVPTDVRNRSVTPSSGSDRRDDDSLTGILTRPFGWLFGKNDPK